MLVLVEQRTIISDGTAQFQLLIVKNFTSLSGITIFCFIGLKKNENVQNQTYAKSLGKKMNRNATFNRFILLGLERQQECIALFTERIDETKIILRFFFEIMRGTEVFVLKPRLYGYIGDTNTAFITTAQPLIPLCMRNPTILFYRNTLQRTKITLNSIL